MAVVIGQFRFFAVAGPWAVGLPSGATLILFSFYKNAVMAYCLFFYGRPGFGSRYISLILPVRTTSSPAQIFWLGMFTGMRTKGGSHHQGAGEGRQTTLKLLAWQVNAVLPVSSSTTWATAP